MNNEAAFFYALILSVSLVNYVLRMVPAVFISKIRFGAYLQCLLDLIPYTAMTALVFPGIFYCVEGHMAAAFVGTVTAVLCAVLKAPLSVTVIAAVIAVLLLVMF